MVSHQCAMRSPPGNIFRKITSTVQSSGLCVTGINTLVLETLRVFQSFRKKYLISYDLPKIIFLIVTILKELNILQDLDSV